MKNNNLQKLQITDKTDKNAFYIYSEICMYIYNYNK